jgi:hypothetical protein
MFDAVLMILNHLSKILNAVDSDIDKTWKLIIPLRHFRHNARINIPYALIKSSKGVLIRESGPGGVPTPRLM